MFAELVFPNLCSVLFQILRYIQMFWKFGDFMDLDPAWIRIRIQIDQTLWIRIRIQIRIHPIRIHITGYIYIVCYYIAVSGSKGEEER